MMQRFLKLTSLKLTSLKFIGPSLILGLALQGTALAQTFGAESLVYAQEAQTLQGANEHKKAIKQLKKGLKLGGLSPFETSTMYQMMGASYYARGKNTDTIEAFENAVQAGGLSHKDKTELQVNIAKINIAEENYALGAQQLETYFREGGLQQSSPVKSIVRAYLRAGNRDAAVPWAETMLRQGFVETQREHEIAIYLFDSAEKRASQMQVARQLYAKWPNDPDVLARIARLNVKAKLEGVPTIFVAG